MQARTEQFVGLSAVLTGFARMQLLGTAMADEYLRAVDAILPAGVLDELLGVYQELPAGDGLEAAVAARILGDPKLGPVAQNLILLWYCGAWTILPAQWRTAYGATPGDKTGVVSAAAYQAGLQWMAAGAHAAGSQQQGFGAWSMPPEGSGL